MDAFSTSEAIDLASCAYVTLVMLGDAYACGAIPLALSLMERGSQAKRVVMVTHDVSEAARTAVAKFFHEVVEVPYIQVPTTRQRYHEEYYRPFIDSIFTKLNAMSLVQYQKVMWIDADTICLQNPDDLFYLPAPAGSCSAMVYGPFPDDLHHGTRVAESIIEISIQFGGMLGYMYLLKPDQQQFLAMCDFLKAQAVYGSPTGRPGPDELFITEWFKSSWTHVRCSSGAVATLLSDRPADTSQGEVPSQIRPVSKIIFLCFMYEKPWSVNGSYYWPEYKYWDAMAAKAILLEPSIIPLFPIGFHSRILLKIQQGCPRSELSLHPSLTRVSRVGCLYYSTPSKERTQLRRKYTSERNYARVWELLRPLPDIPQLRRLVVPTKSALNHQIGLYRAANGLTEPSIRCSLQEFLEASLNDT